MFMKTTMFFQHEPQHPVIFIEHMRLITLLFLISCSPYTGTWRSNIHVHNVAIYDDIHVRITEDSIFINDYAVRINRVSNHRYYTDHLVFVHNPDHGKLELYNYDNKRICSILNLKQSQQ
jgi:hypothetical protein